MGTWDAVVAGPGPDPASAAPCLYVAPLTPKGLLAAVGAACFEGLRRQEHAEGPNAQVGKGCGVGGCGVGQEAG